VPGKKGMWTAECEGCFRRLSSRCAY
jgi:hypothetical protein